MAQLDVISQEEVLQRYVSTYYMSYQIISYLTNISYFQLWDSIQKLLSLPDDTRIFVGHDYPPAGRSVEWESTVGKIRDNIHLKGKTKEEVCLVYLCSVDNIHSMLK